MNAQHPIRIIVDGCGDMDSVDCELHVGNDIAEFASLVQLADALEMLFPIPEVKSVEYVHAD